jgi:hypothetical protein
MIAFFLSLLDVLSGIFMLLLHFDLIGWRPAFGFSIYLIAKGIAFRGEFLSIIDLLMGLYLIFMFFGVKTFLVYVFFAYTIYKATISLIPMK